MTRPWKALFVSSDDDISGWWNRWKLDRYSMILGVIFGFLVAMAKRAKLLTKEDSGLASSDHDDDVELLLPRSKITKDETSLKPFESKLVHLTRRMLRNWIFRSLVVLICIGGLAGYSTFAHFCNTQLNCKEIHPYLVALPV